jgi:ABC-type nitrate/sulfonate/bicarbonate transport system ATPase subunit
VKLITFWNVSIPADGPFVDPALKGIRKKVIKDRLAEVGFDAERQMDLVGGLSGGWKMRLELARAMLYNADLLLLDEVRFFPYHCKRMLICSGSLRITYVLLWW